MSGQKVGWRVKHLYDRGDHGPIHEYVVSDDVQIKALESEGWEIEYAYTKVEPEWQPIETAPIDTEILLGPTKRMAICVGLNCSRDGWVTETPSEWVSIYPPTHWMPLPEPPKDTTP